MKTNYKIQGKKNRESGQRFELKVRKDLESKGWIVDRWSNNVEFKEHWFCGCEDIFPRIPTPDGYHDASDFSHKKIGKLIPAKSRFNLRTTGFPDFIAFKQLEKGNKAHGIKTKKDYGMPFIIVGFECKSNGYLTKEEKEKCKWLLENNVFSKILIAKKGKKRGEIEYTEFK